MKITKGILLLVAGLFLSCNPVHAQALNPSSSTDCFGSDQDLRKLLDALAQVEPVPFDQVPPQRFSPFGYWSFQNPFGPPLPGNPLKLDLWSLGDGFFVLDDRHVDYAALEAEWLAALAAEAAGNSHSPQMRMMSSSLLNGYGNPVYLANLVATNTGTMTVAFDIAGGTNSVPYDIVMTTNLTTPMAAWTWLGMGYTSNRYAFTAQPTDAAFYRLARPSKTMVVAWGNNQSNQCDVPYGLTNAVMLSGNNHRTIALLSDGTLKSWGDDSPTNLAGVSMIASGLNHDLALLTNGTVKVWGNNIFGELNAPFPITNGMVVSAQGFNSLVLTSNGTVVAWGDNSGVTNIPSDLTNVMAIACGGQHNLAVKADGTVVAWGSGAGTLAGNLTNVVDVAAGWNHSVALKDDGSVVCWGNNAHGQCSVPGGLSNVVAIAAGGKINGTTGYTLALKKDGTVAVWGTYLITTPLAGLNNVIAIGGGLDNGLALRTGPPTPVITLEPVDTFQMPGSNATFTAKGQGLYGVTYQWQTNDVNLPGATSAALTVTNVQAAQIAISYRVIVGNEVGSLVSSNANMHFVTPPIILSRSLPTNPVVAYQSNLTLSVVASAPGTTNGFPLAYQWQFNGSDIAFANSSAYTIHGYSDAFGFYSVQVSNAAGSTNVVWQVIVLNTNGLLVTLHPTNQYQIAGGSVTFAASGVGLNPVTYQWTFNTTNLPGATNATLTLTNVQFVNQGNYAASITDGVSSLTSSNAGFTLVTPPVMTTQSTPTNRVCIEGNYLSFTASFTAPGLTNGFPLGYQWKFNGTNINFQNSTSYVTYAVSTGIYSVQATNAAGSTNLAWQVTVTNAINVTNDLLLIYNTNSIDSIVVKDYYLAHRPMVGGANVLGIGCSATNEKMADIDFTNQILAPYLNWLTNNPAKHPQYIILFPDIPSRAYDPYVGSVQYAFYHLTPNGTPFSTSINFNGTNDCIGYINKLATFGSNSSPGKLIISASEGGYSNTNFVLDGIRSGPGTTFDYTYAVGTAADATNGLLSAGVSPQAILFSDGIEFTTNGINYFLPHPTNAVNVAGYFCWGAHSSLDVDYALPNGKTPVTWTGNSGWWIMKSNESHNGDRVSDMGNFLQWFSPNAFGETNYSNTPIGSCSNVEEPGAEGGATVSVYFNLWATGHHFGVCAWNARHTIWFQASGDPFVSK
jgi:hypothetical protein